MEFADEIGGPLGILASVGGTNSSAAIVAVDQLCRWVEGHPSQIEELKGRIDSSWRIDFLAYSWRMAQDAVRESDARLIMRGSIALALEGGVVDIRDNIIRAVVLYHSCSVLGVEPSLLFDRAAELAGNSELGELLRGFPQRTPEARRLSAFYIEALGTGTTFSYRFSPSGLARKNWLSRLRIPWLWRRTRKSGG